MVDFTAVIAILFLVSALIPLVRQGMLNSARLRLLRQIEEKRGSRVIAMIHRQETLALLGFPLTRYIDIHDSEELLRAIKLTDPDVPIDLILHTPGGLVLASEQIANALQRHNGKVTVFVPHYAMSGGTLIALAADEIVLGEFSVLGPIDPQIAGLPAVIAIASGSRPWAARRTSRCRSSRSAVTAGCSWRGGAAPAGA